jgi:hypothetical protein
MIGPMCPGPVPIGDTRCQDQPYQATIVVLDSENKELSTIASDSAGYFILSLPPGNYTLHPISGRPIPIAPDQPVIVSPGQYTPVTILYDTGMR